MEDYTILVGLFQSDFGDDYWPNIQKSLIIIKTHTKEDEKSSSGADIINKIDIFTKKINKIDI